jgi:hypothetical protein
MEWYTKPLLLTHKDKYFVFGDNYARKGLGGQAKVCRGFPNTIGIITKKYPSYSFESYYYEIEFGIWLEHAMGDLAKVQDYLEQGMTVVYPQEGVGTGLSQLPQKAPSIYNYIEKFFNRMKETYGENSSTKSALPKM